MRPLSTALAVAAALAATSTCGAQSVPRSANPLFELLDRWDRLDTRELTFVRVQRLQNGYVTRRYGWRLDANGQRHRVRYLDLGRETVKPDPRTRIEEVPLLDAVAAVCQDVRALQDRDGNRWFSPSPENPMHPEGLAVLLARACERRGLNHAVEQLLTTAAQHRLYLARGLHRRLTIDFADPQITWQLLLQRHQLLVASFGEQRPTGSADRRSANLEQVIARLADPTTSRVKRILIEDPWLDGNVKFDSGPMSPPDPLPPAGQRPLDALLAQGLAVVPELIELLEDPTVTRSLYYSTKFGGVFGANVVGDQAHAALKRLIGHSPPKSNLRAGRRKAWQDYFDENAVDDLRTLAEQNLEARPARTVRYYLSNWPDGIDRVLELAAQSSQARPATGLASVLIEDPRWRRLPRVRQLVRRCLANETVAHWRTSLAEKALAAELPEGLSAVEKMWRARNLFDLKPSDRGQHDQARAELRLLMRYGNAATWQSLREGNAFETVRQRCAEVLLETPELLATAGLLADGREVDLAAAQSALALLLTDMEAQADRYAIPSASGFVELQGVVCADAAALALASLRPAMFNYTPVREAAARHRQLALLRQLVAR